MTRDEFEAAIQEAVDADPKNGAKWAPLQAAFAEEGILAGGAISNQQPEQRTRIRQILTRRKVGGKLRYFQFAVLVLNQEQATRHQANPGKVLGSVVEMLEAERPLLPPTDCLECALVMRHDDGQDLVPLALVTWGNGVVTQQMQAWYPAAELVDLSATIPTFGHASAAPAAGAQDAASAGKPLSFNPGDNVIFFGPPGTGKSYRIREETADFFDVLMTAFHPEYAYSDFVGAYKPVCGSEDGSTIRDFSGEYEIGYPVVYYTFEPGVFVRAIVRAQEADGAPVALVIDELNRGDCAAIFGDFMHLLDRADSGRSEYGLDVTLPLGAYLVDAGVLDSPTEKLFLPANLHIFATINTADQALYPIDSAFKRRWSWEAVPIAGGPDLATVTIPAVGDAAELLWLDFIERLNAVILHHTENEDKRIGPWFIKAIDDQIPPKHLRNKLLYFLWHDVFRGHTSEVFLPGLRTFEAVQAAFDAHGVPGVLSAFAPAPEPPQPVAELVEPLASEDGEADANPAP
jgi:hypothetical protein